MTRRKRHRVQIRGDGAAVPAFGPVRQPERFVRVCKAGIECDGGLAGRDGRVRPLVVEAEPQPSLGVRVGQSCPWRGIGGIQGDGSLEEADRLLVVLVRVGAIGLSALNVEVVGSEAARGCRCETAGLVARQGGLEGSRHLSGDLALNVEDIVQLPVERM